MKLEICVLSALACAACSRQPAPDTPVADAPKSAATHVPVTDMTKSAPEVVAPEPAAPATAIPKETPMSEKEPFSAGEATKKWSNRTWLRF